MTTTSRQLAIASALFLDNGGGAVAFKKLRELGVRGEHFSNKTAFAVFATAERLEEQSPGEWSPIELKDAVADRPAVLSIPSESVNLDALPSLAGALVDDFQQRKVEHELFPRAMEEWRNGGNAASLFVEMSHACEAGRSGGDCWDVLSGEELDAKEYGEQQWIVDRFIRVGGFTHFSAPAKEGKSLVALDMSLNVALGKVWLGLLTQPMPVLYCNLEMPGALMQTRYRTLCKAYRCSLSDAPLYFLNGLEQHAPPTWNNLHSNLEKVARKLKPPFLVIVDCQYWAALGVDENSIEQMGPVMAAFKQIGADFGGCFVLHHTGYNKKRQRGHSVQEAVPDACARMGRPSKEQLEKAKTPINPAWRKLILDGQFREGWSPVLFGLDLETGRTYRIADGGDYALRDDEELLTDKDGEQSSGNGASSNGGGGKAGAPVKEDAAHEHARLAAEMFADINLAKPRTELEQDYHKTYGGSESTAKNAIRDALKLKFLRHTIHTNRHSPIELAPLGSEAWSRKNSTATRPSGGADASA